MGMSFADQKPGSGVAGRAWGFVLLVFATSHLFYLIGEALLVKVVPIDPLWGGRSDAHAATSKSKAPSISRFRSCRFTSLGQRLPTSHAEPTQSRYGGMPPYLFIDSGEVRWEDIEAAREAVEDSVPTLGF
jgi:hypothetical protein